MILHTGLRTDIPAFYPEWLANRIKEGYALVRNPFNPNQITKYRISPEVVDVISFCTILSRASHIQLLFHLSKTMLCSRRPFIKALTTSNHATLRTWVFVQLLSKLGKNEELLDKSPLCEGRKVKHPIMIT